MTRMTTAWMAALVVALAIGAVSAPAAQAGPGRVTSAANPVEYPLILTGEIDTGGALRITFGKEVRTVSCVGTKVDSTINGPDPAPVFKPTFTNCTAAPGSLTTDVTPNECSFKLTVPESTSSAMSTTIENCPSTAPLLFRITESGGKTICEYKMENQGPLTGSTWTNNAETEKLVADVTLVINMNPAATVVVGSAIACGAAAGNAVAVSYKEPVTVRAWNDINGQEGNIQRPIMIGP